MSMATIEESARWAQDPVWMFEKRIKIYLSVNGFAISILASDAQSFDTVWNVCDRDIIKKRNYI
jgi:hypothetical protein